MKTGTSALEGLSLLKLTDSKAIKATVQWRRGEAAALW